MNNITVNGKSYQVEGNNISIVNDKVVVDGKVISEGNTGITEIRWEGPLANLDCHNARITGNVQGDVDAHNVTCGNVGGSVDAHNVTCANVGGNVKGKIVSSV